MTGRTIVAWTTAVFIAAPSGSVPDARDWLQVQQGVALMGTRVTLTSYAASRADGLGALEVKIRSLEDSEAQLSTWRHTSAMSQLNRLPLGVAGALEAPLCSLFDQLRQWQRKTSGAFDPAIGAMIEAWDLRGAGRQPSESELTHARANSGMERLTLDLGTCSLTRRADIRLDAGAFGKGAALDRLEKLQSHRDVGPWLVDLGGQMAASGPRPDGSGWPISLAHPAARQLPAVDLELRGGSVATSGGSERDRTVGGRRIGHLLDPRTGYAAAFDGSVTVWHEQALAADVLSTALFVMGVDEGLRWADRHGVAALFLVPIARHPEQPPLMRPSRAFTARVPSWRPAGA